MSWGRTKLSFHDCGTANSFEKRDLNYTRKGILKEKLIVQHKKARVYGMIGTMNFSIVSHPEQIHQNV
jgi:hypothetical protein